ncbi:hypothetical protein LCGC14_1136660 [marine sediment metagenome]|uniref:Uncharacterized protein n=1 Tax=marine sediment metagenome TaxID=412755 RepID=A0A0F9PHP3_9ZZZZ
MTDILFPVLGIIAGGVVIAAIVNQFFPFDGRLRPKRGEQDIPYRSWQQVLKEFGGEEGFYDAVDDGRVSSLSDDYNRFYVPGRHSRVILTKIIRHLDTRDSIPEDLRVSLARLEGLLAGR